MLAIYGQARVGGDPVPQDGRIPTLQGDGQAAPLASLLTTLTAPSPKPPRDSTTTINID